MSLMEYLVEYTDEFGEWWDTLTDSEQASVDAYVRNLEQLKKEKEDDR